MESDIQALSARISRLEVLLGPQSQKPCTHTATKTALSNLRKHVPDEMAAANRAVDLLSRATTRKLSPIDIDQPIRELQQLDALQSSLRAPRHDVDSEALTGLQMRVARIANVVRGEELAVDELLTEFDAVTARFNDTILLLAEKVSSLVVLGDEETV